MDNVVLKVENISKQYRLGIVSTGTLSQDINRWWHLFRGKEDPYLKIGEENPREVMNGEYVWALKDISFDVTEGEVLGIIGKNGAGKSTLLKILSQITKPTTGSVKVKGRIASLLEVGTGFHPELTGIENIFLNGTILGMTKAEIKKKLDEIIDFSGVVKYIDTPVKRYSSGMRVRLGFAIAAHLEPEILIVDEVLAVGDAEFQKKCMGKMKDVAGQGRTVLFVSHNMTAIQTLCQNAILLQNGKIVNSGKAGSLVDEYLKLNSSSVKNTIQFDSIENAMGNENIKIKSIKISPSTITIDKEIIIEFVFWNLTKENNLKMGFDLVNIHGQIVFGTGTDIFVKNENIGIARCTIPENLLNDDIYSIYLYFNTNGMKPLFNQKEIVSFAVLDIERNYAYLGKINGVIRPILKWETSI